MYYIIKLYIVKEVGIIMKYFHIDLLVEYVEKFEGQKFKIIKSKDYGIDGLLAFTAIISSNFEVEKVNIKEDKYKGYVIEIKDKWGRNALNAANIVFWNSELASSESEESSYIFLEEVENGALVFENFNEIPEYISVEEIEEFLQNK